MLLLYEDEQRLPGTWLGGNPYEYTYCFHASIRCWYDADPGVMLYETSLRYTFSYDYFSSKRSEKSEFIVGTFYSITQAVKSIPVIAQKWFDEAPSHIDRDKFELIEESL